MNTPHEVGLSLGAALTSTIGGASLTAGPGAASGGFSEAFLAAVVIAAVGVVAARMLMPTKAYAPGRPMFAH